MRKQVEALEHHADLAPHVVDALEVGSEFDAVDHDLTFLEFLQRIDAADGGGLAGAGRAADDDAFALADGEVDVAEHMEFAEPFVQTGDLDHLCHASLVLRCGDER